MFICHGAAIPKRLEENSDEVIIQQCRAHTTSIALLVRHFMAQVKGKATITIISSITCFTHFPNMALYCSFKRFSEKFVKQMQSEGPLFNVTFQCIMPGDISGTDFSRTFSNKVSLKLTPPEKVADAILSTAGKNITFDFGIDAIFMRLFVWLLPSSIADLFFSKAGVKIF